MKELIVFVVLFLCFIRVSYTQIDLSNGLIASYPFNGNANDTVSGFNGTISGNVTPTTDRFGNPNSAYDFGGTNADFIEVAHNAALNFSLRSFTISLWAYRPNPPSTPSFNGMIISKGVDILDGYSIRVNADGNGNAGFRLGNPVTWFYSKDDLRSPRDIGSNVWTHYVAVYYDLARAMYFYEDGILVAQKFMSFNFEQTNTLPLTFGQHSADSRPANATALYPFKGKIDDIKIYDRPLFDCEVYALANDIDTCYTTNDNLIAQYDYCGNGIDNSGHGNNGTLSGDTLVNDRFSRSFSAKSFSGINSGMNISEVSLFDFDTADFAMSTWFRTTSGGTVQRFISNGDKNSSNGYVFGMNMDTPGSISFGIGANGNIAQSAFISTQNTFADGQWHHAVATANRVKEKLYIYVDGLKQLINKSPASAGTVFGRELLTSGLNNLNASSPDNLTVGKYSNNTENFSGTLDDIRVYNRPLFNTDIKGLFYQAQPGGFCCPFVATPATQNYSVCGNGALTLGATAGYAAYGYEWYTKSIGGAVLGASSTLNVSNIMRDTVFFVSNVLNSNCKSSRVAVYVVITIPSAPIIPDGATCSPGSITLSATGTGLIKWYNSSVGGTLLGSGPTLFIPSQTVTGKYFASNTKDGCESLRDSTIAYVRPIPSVAGINGPVSVCPSVTSIGYGVNSLPGYTYQWSVTGGTFVGTQIGDTVAITWGVATAAAKVRIEPTNEFGCKGPVFTKNVVVNSVLGIGTIPIGDSIICTANATGRLYYLNPSTGSTYRWTVINGTKTTSDNYFILVNATAPGLMKLTVFETVTTSSNVVCQGQSDTLNVITYLSPDSTLNIQADPYVCKTSTPLFSLNGFNTSTYQWSVTNGNIISGQGNKSITSSLIDTGNVKLTVRETSNKGCIGKLFTKTITSNIPFVTNIILGEDTVCTRFGQKQVYSVTGFDGSSYVWSSNVSDWHPLPGSTTGSTFVLTSPDSGYIKVKEIPVFPNACPHGTDSLKVIVYQSPVNTSITGRDRFCENTLNEPYSIKGLPNSTFSWWAQQTKIKSGQGTENIVLDFPRSGTVRLTVLEKTKDGCLGDSIATQKIIQVDRKPIAKNIIGDSIPCTTKLDSIPYYLNGLVGSDFHWDLVGENITLISGQSTEQILVRLDSNYWHSRYWIKVVETSGPDCVGDTVKKFVRIGRPYADIKSVSVSETDEHTIELNTFPTDHSSSFVREPGNVFAIPFHTTQFLDKNLHPDSIIYQYQIIEKDNCGKVYNSSFHNNILLVGKSDSTYGSARLNWTPYVGWNEGIKEYQVWRAIGEGGVSEKYGTLSPDSLKGNFVVGADGSVQIFRIKAVGKDESRVATSNPVKLLFNDVPRVYSAFSPNGDNINDTWVVDRLNLYPNNKVTIMDKWGTPVFEKSNYFKEWDGTHNGRDVPAGIYYYVIDLGPGRKPISGTVSVIR